MKSFVAPLEIVKTVCNVSANVLIVFGSTVRPDKVESMINFNFPCVSVYRGGATVSGVWVGVVIVLDSSR